jgi:hypothetical protein
LLFSSPALPLHDQFLRDLKADVASDLQGNACGDSDIVSGLDWRRDSLTDFDSRLEPRR